MTTSALALPPRWYKLDPHPEQKRLITEPKRFKVCPAGRRSGKCLASGQRVAMVDGSWMPVEKVAAGDVVWSVAHDLRLEPRQVSHVYSNGRRDIVSISASNQALLCTANHPLLVNNEWTEAGGIQPGDHVGVYAGPRVQWKRVLDVASAGQAETFDLTVEGNHNFIAEGFVTHNTERAKRYGIRRALRERHIPDFRAIFGAPTREQAKRIYWKDLKRFVPEWAMLGKPSEVDLIIRLINGAQIEVHGMDKPERIEGAPVDWICLDEYGNMKPTAWHENVRPALSTRGRPGEGWFIGVPEGRNHYWDLYLFGCEPENQTDWGVYHWPSWDIIPQAEVDAARKEMDEITFRQEYGGEFLSFSGQAYYNFDRSVHAVEPLEYMPDRPLVFGFDFNVDPGVAVIAQEQPYQGTRKTVEPWITAIIDEVYIPKNSYTPIVCRELLRRWGKHRGHVHIYGDASGGARHSAAVTGTNWDIVKEMLGTMHFRERYHHHVRLKNPPERGRVNAVNARLRDAEGRVRMLVSPTCKRMIKDFEGVAILEGTAGDIDKKSDLALTHISDAIGYYTVAKFPLRRVKTKTRAF